MTVTLLQQWDRPDGNMTDRRSNLQVLSNENVFINWTDWGYVSEYAADGRLVMEAKFMSARMDTYRAYKFNWTGVPTEPPALKAYAYGGVTSSNDIVSVTHVSWNGATEVASWNFYGAEDL